ncbi:hypothetical protein E4U32_005805 [Claviceps aff. humidiphila group G2b]|nr:hypothetical protein E4U32_005805 [Claviceps aff. humidiphila group G2b]
MPLEPTTCEGLDNVSEYRFGSECQKPDGMMRLLPSYRSAAATMAEPQQSPVHSVDPQPYHAQTLFHRAAIVQNSFAVSHIW